MSCWSCFDSFKGSQGNVHHLTVFNIQYYEQLVFFLKFFNDLNNVYNERKYKDIDKYMFVCHYILDIKETTIVGLFRLAAN